MPDEPFDEPFKPAHDYRPLSDDLETEIEDFERRAMEALQTGKQSAELRYTFQNLKTGEEWARIDVYGPGRSYGTAMPKEKAVRFVRITNSAHQILDTLLHAYVNADAKTAIAYVRKLFRTIKAARQLGRPPEPYKDAVRDKILTALAREPLQPRQAKVEKAILKLCNESLSERQARNWAREFMEIDLHRRHKGQ